MNTDAIGIADVWNALAIDEGYPPWSALTPEEKAAQQENWNDLGAENRWRLRQRAGTGPAPADRNPRAMDDAALQRAVNGIEAGIKEALKRLDVPEWLATTNAVDGAELEFLLDDPDAWLEGRSIVNDALIHGEIDSTILDRKIVIGSSPNGAATARGRWKNWETTVRDLLTRLSEHKEGMKDGPSLLQGPVIDGIRQANAIPYLDLLILDLDTGESIEAIRQRLMDLGLFGIIYTTFSNMKPITDVKRDEVIHWLGGEVEEPDVEQVCEYLRKKKRYQPAILEGAALLPTEHTSGGVMLRIKHQPMAKLRVVLVLRERFEIAKRSLLQRDALNEWRERYAGASKLLGAYFDRSCTDSSRLFFSPRHPKGAKEWRIEVIAGKPLDLDQVERISAEDLRREAESPFEAAARAMGAGGEYATVGLKRFFARFGDRFEIDEFLLDVDPDGDRGPRNGPGRHHRCPNDDSHSDSGNPEDRAFFVVNASDGDSAVAHCMHDSCSQLDRINFTDLACQAAGIRDATELRRWVPATVEDDEEEGSKASGVTLPDNYENHEGFLCYLEWQDKKIKRHKLCGALDIIGTAHSENNNQWGLLVRFKDRVDHEREMVLTFADVLSDPGVTLATLADAGLWIDGDRTNKGRLCTCLSRIKADNIVINATQPGWHDGAFLSPLGQVRGGDPSKLRLAETAHLDSCEPRGTLEGWKRNAKEALDLCDFHAAVTLGAAFAGPLVALAGGDSCGISPTGPSSVGKTLSAKVAAAAWSDPTAKKGLLCPAYGTLTGIESRMMQANGTTLFLDELKHLRQDQIAELIFAFSGGSTKDRGRPDGSLRQTRQSAFYWWMSAEKGIRQAIEAAGQEYVTGIGVRNIDIDVSSSKPHADVGRVKRLESGVADHYGHAGVSFIEHLLTSTPYVENRGALLDALAEAREWLLADGVKDGPRGRAAHVLAYALAAGEIAQRAGLLPPGDYMRAAFRRAWDASLGDDEAEIVNGPDQAISNLQGKILDLWDVHGWDEDSDDVEKRLHREKWFYKAMRFRDDDSKVPYIVVRTDAMEKLLDPGVKRKAVLDRLRELGWLLPRGRNNSHGRLPGGEKANHYRLSADQFGPGSSSPDA